MIKEVNTIYVIDFYNADTGHLDTQYASDIDAAFELIRESFTSEYYDKLGAEAGKICDEITDVVKPDAKGSYYIDLSGYIGARGYYSIDQAPLYTYIAHS